MWLMIVRYCSRWVSPYCSSHHSRPLFLSSLMPAIMQTWGLSRIARRLFAATPPPANPLPPHRHQYRGRPPGPPTGGGIQIPERAARPVISLSEI